MLHERLSFEDAAYLVRKWLGVADFPTRQTVRNWVLRGIAPRGLSANTEWRYYLRYFKEGERFFVTETDLREFLADAGYRLPYQPRRPRPRVRIDK